MDFHRDNVVAHVTRHYLERRSERWADLQDDGGKERWRAADAALEEAVCDRRGHMPGNCPDFEGCDGAAQGVAPDYLELVLEELRFAVDHELAFAAPHGEWGQARVAFAGPRGIFGAVAWGRTRRGAFEPCRDPFFVTAFRVGPPRGTARKRRPGRPGTTLPIMALRAVEKLTRDYSTAAGEYGGRAVFIGWPIRSRLGGIESRLLALDADCTIGEVAEVLASVPAPDRTS